MMALISENWLFFLIALVIGVATAFWAWAATGREAETSRFNADDGLLERAETSAAPVAPEPVAPPPVAAPPVTAPPAPEPEAAPAPTPTPEPAPEPAAPASVVTEQPKPVVTPAPALRPRTRPVAADTAPPPPGKPNIPPAVGEPDNLRLIKGVGPKLNSLLNNLGITRVDQTAEWKEAEIEEVDKYLES